MSLHNTDRERSNGMKMSMLSNIASVIPCASVVPFVSRRLVLRLAVIVLAVLVALPAVAAPSKHRGPHHRDPKVLTIPAGPDTSVHYVGVTDDPDVYVAVIERSAGFVRVYLCDGVDLGVWLTGQGTAGEALQVEAKDGSTGEVTVADGTASGSVTLADGTTFTFAVSQAGLPAGLYERTGIEEGEAVQARTIVLPDGTAKGRKKPYDCNESFKLWDTQLTIASTFPAGSDEAGEWYHGAATQRQAAEAAGCAWASPAN